MLTKHLLFLFVVPLLALGVCLTPAAAVSRETDPGLALAKVAANESEIDDRGRADVLLIWQSSAAHARTTQGRIRWLRAHSRCVLGDVDPDTRPGKCRWTRLLERSDERPAGHRGTWNGEAWLNLLAFADRVVAGHVPAESCAPQPTTWDGPSGRAGAEARGLIPVACEDPRTGLRPRNLGWADPWVLRRAAARSRAASLPPVLRPVRTRGTPPGPAPHTGA